MKITLKVKPGAKQEKIEKVGEKSFLVWVKEPAKEGKANKAVIRILAKYLGIPQAEIRLVAGQSSRQKIIELP